MFGPRPSDARQGGLLPAQEPAVPADLVPMAAEPVPQAPAAPQRTPSSPRVEDTAEGVTPPRNRGGARRPLLDVLVDLRFTTPERLEFARHTARMTGKTPEQVLLDENTITADQMARAVAERFGVDHLDLTRFKVDMV